MLVEVERLPNEHAFLVWWQLFFLFLMSINQVISQRFPQHFFHFLVIPELKSFTE